MEGNTTDQDELLAKISGLTSGMGTAPSMSQNISAPVAPTFSQEPTMTQTNSVPTASSFDPSMDQNLMKAPVPDNNELQIDLGQGNTTQYTSQNQVPPEMPNVNAMPNNMGMPNITNNIPAPEMPLPQANDSFAASLGATPVSSNDPFGVNNESQVSAPQENAIPSMTSRIPTPDNKIPTFDKPIKKKSNGAFGFIVALLILAIIAAGVFALYKNGIFDKLLNKNNSLITVQDDTSLNEEDPFATEEVETPEVTVSQAEFVDNTVTAGVSDKVIKAEYKVEGIEYDDSYISLPYLNINSDDANEINKDLQTRYKDYANISADFRTDNKVELLSDATNFKQRYLIVYYQAITQGDIISLLINELKYDGISDAVWNHYTYCISASTGKKLSLEDLQTILNVDNNLMNSAYETYIQTYISSMTASDSKKIFEHKINSFKTLQDYYSNINNGEGIYYYVDGSGRINIITKVYLGDKNVFKVVAYSPTSGCVVKEFKINDAKTACGFEQMTKESLSNDNNGGAALNAASSTLKVSANSLTSLKSGDKLYGEDVKKIYSAYEYMLGTKGESLTFQITTSNGTKSYSKGETEIIQQDVNDNNIYDADVVKYESGNYRILRFRLNEN